jgi:hypothetical protein
MAAAVVEIGCLFVSFFYRINNLFGDTGFRSSIISLNSESEICIGFTNICCKWENGHENTSIKSCFD